MFTVYRGAARSGKTARILEMMYAELDTGHEPLLIVPTRYLKDMLSRRISEERGGFTGKLIVTLNELVNGIVSDPATGASLTLQRINDFEAYLLIDFIIQEMKNELVYFKNSVSNSGIVKMLYSLISELRASMVLHPDGEDAYAILKDAYPSDSDRHRKWADIWRIYHEYEKRLDSLDLVDSYRVLKIATERLENGSAGNFNSYHSLYFDGFFDFTHSQFRLVGALIERYLQDGKEAVMTLPASNFTVVDETVRQFKQRFSIRWCELKSERRFSDQIERLLSGESMTGRHEVKLTEIHAFGKYRETERIAHEICRLVREEGYSYQDIAVIVRNPDSYRDILHDVFRQLEIPYYQSRDDQLKSNPVIIMIYNLFRYAVNGMDNTAVLGIARSGYVKKKWAALSEINNLLTEYINGDMKDWIRHMEGKIRFLRMELNRILIGEEDESDFLRDTKVIEYRIQGLERLNKTLKEFLQIVFHFKDGETYTVDDLIRWLSSLIDELGIYDALRSSELKDKKQYLLLTRDFMAFRRLKESLTSMMKAVIVLGKSRFSAQELFDIFDNLISDIRYRYRFYPSNSVKVLSPFDARESTFKAVFIPGLNENEFPGKSAITLADYRERMKLNDMTKVMILDDDKRRINLERMDFYVAVTRATDRIYFGHTPFDETGSQILPSIFLEEIRNKTNPGDIRSIPPKKDDEIYSDDIFQIVPSQKWMNIEHIKPLLLYERGSISAERIKLAGEKYPFLVDTGRMAHYHDLLNRCYDYYENDEGDSKGLFTGYLGGLSFEGGDADRANREWVARLLDQLPYSATSLQSAGNCRYQFFIRYVLGVLEENIPRPEIETRQRGTFYHLALKYYLQLTESHRYQDLPDGTALDQALHQVTAELTDKTGDIELWEIEIKHYRNVLYMFAQWEKELRDASPTLFEHPINKRLMELKPELSIQIQGNIDRVDRYESGAHRVIDYKSNDITFVKDDVKIPFKHFQGYVYAKALIDDGLPVNEIGFVSIEKRDKNDVLPLTYNKREKKYPTITEFNDIWAIKSEEIIYLIHQMKGGNFLCYDHIEDFSDADHILDFYRSMNADQPVALESAERCRYCAYQTACLRREKLSSKFDIQ